MIIKANPKKAELLEIATAVANNGGYCPCELTKTDDTYCMCKSFRDKTDAGFCHCGRFYKYNQYKIITLCGSTRFKDEFIKVQRELTLQGNIVISVGLFGHADSAPSESEKQLLDDIHKSKIAMSDEIFVINVGGYIGESTRSEIEWAEALNKPIRYLEELK